MASRKIKGAVGISLIGLAAVAPFQEIINPAGKIEFELTKSPKKYLINEHLPFRLRIENIGLSGYTRENPAPIGVAIIGHSNYIL